MDECEENRKDTPRGAPQEQLGGGGRERERERQRDCGRIKREGDRETKRWTGGSGGGKKRTG